MSAVDETASGAAVGFPPFRPCPLLFHGHLMNFTVVLPRAAVPGDCEDIDVGPCARLRIVWNVAENPAAPVLVLMHGLTGSARTSYMVGIAAKAIARGLSVVRVQARGCGETEALARPMFHAGLSEDLAAVVDHVAARLPDAPIHLAGFSLGANVVLKLCGTWGATPPPRVRSAVVLSPAIDLAACGARLDRDRRLRLYRQRFVAALRRMVHRHADAFDLDLDRARLDGIRTMRDFDAFYTAPVWGYAGVDDYYARASALPWVERSRVPTLAIAARDDLLVPFGTLAPLRAALPPERFVVTAHGGHVAFIGRSRAVDAHGRRDPDRRWAENRVVQWVVDRSARAADDGGS